MADKLYTKNTWTDEQLASGALYDISESDDTPINENVKIELATEVVTAGTPANATRMNNLENGINNIDDLLVSLQSKLRLDAATEIAVSSGTLTLTQSVHKVQPESGTEDEVDNLAGLSAGQVGLLYASDAGTDTLTLKHGTGNISCFGGSDIDLSEGAVIVYYDGTTYFIAGDGGGAETPDPTYLCQGRLTLESGNPNSSTEQSAKSTLYFENYFGDFLDLYDGTKWVRHQFTQRSLDITGLTASKLHDIFIYDNAGTITLEAVEWTDGSNRSVALALQNGVYVKSGSPSHRYIGLIYIDASQRCNDTLRLGHVVNIYNRLERRFYMAEGTNHNYTGAARLWNNSETNNRMEVITPFPDFLKIAGLARLKGGADGNYAFAYFYIDGGISGYYSGNYNVQVTMAGSYMNIPMNAGYHYFNVYEAGDHASSQFIAMYVYASNWR